MSKLVEFRQLEQDLAEQMKALEALKGNALLKTEIEFESKLRELLGQYGKSLKDVIAILDPYHRRQTADVETSRTRRPRVVKVYMNPHSCEIIETRGGNHKGLKEWKRQYGSDTVESWLTT